jgi:Tfp pilus assembly protein PilW
MIRRSDRGITLVELLIVAVIFGGILLALFISFTMGQGTYLSSDAYIQAQQEARRALDAAGRELREAGNPDSPGTNPNVDFADSARLNFQIALGYFNSPAQAGYIAGCPLNAICWGNDTQSGGWMHYLRNGTQLVRCQTAASDTAIADFSACRVLANGVQTFLIDYSSATRTLTLDLQTQFQALGRGLGGPLASGPLQTRVRLRN